MVILEEKNVSPDRMLRKFLDDETIYHRSFEPASKRLRQCWTENGIGKGKQS